MFRVEFSSLTRWYIFQRDGGRCQLCLRQFTFDQVATADRDGYQIDHIAGAHDNRHQNGRVLCVPCHKSTPSYGNGDPSLRLAALSGGASLQGGPQTNPSYLAALLALLNQRRKY